LLGVTPIPQRPTAAPITRTNEVQIMFCNISKPTDRVNVADTFNCTKNNQQTSGRLNVFGFDDVLAFAMIAAIVVGVIYA
jgi:hypothetical protein